MTLKELESGWKIHVGREEEAVYKQNIDPMYRHNCLIEALPLPLEPAKASRLMLRMPRFNNEERLLPDMQRLGAVQRLAICYFPFPKSIELEQKFHRMLCNGYCARNPLAAETVRQMQSAYENLEWTHEGFANYVPKMHSSASGMAVVGTSGMGKSRTVESVLSLFPQVIVHSSYNGQSLHQKQLVWLMLVCPQNALPKAICFEFFHAVDEILGTHYASQFCKKEFSTPFLLTKMALVARTIGLGVLVIDEVQHINPASVGGKEDLLQFLTQLTTKINIPVLLVGTYKSFGLYTKSLAVARRVEGQGDILMDNLAQDEYWDYFLSSIWRYQWTKVETPLTPALSKVFYEQCQGIVDIAVKLYMLAQWHVIGSEDERITAKTVRDVSRLYLHAVAPIIRAIRENDLATLSQIEDARAPKVDMDEYLKNHQNRVSMSGFMNTLRNQALASNPSIDEGGDHPEVQLGRLLIQAGFSADIAISSAKTALGRFASDRDLTNASAEAFRLAAEALQAKKEDSKKPTGARSKKEKPVPLSGDLRAITKEADDSDSAYEALRSAGVIKPAAEFLPPEETP